jgi:hypothetical protein
MSLSGLIDRAFLGSSHDENPPRKQTFPDRKIGEKKLPRRAISKAEGLFTRKVVIATGRGKPLRVQIPRADST